VKKSAASLFYLPCQAKHPEGSFFVDYDEARRTALEPTAWLQQRIGTMQTSSAEPTKQDRPVASQPRDEQKIEAAIREWRQNGWRPGEGNHRFFELGLKLASSGASAPDLEGMLRSESFYANTPEDRKRQVPSIIQSLTEYGRLDASA
jgi:hypothetical protein